METKNFTTEDLQELEALQIFGGKGPDNAMSQDQYKCHNSAAGCGAGVDQYMCTNGVGYCATEFQTPCR